MKLILKKKNQHEKSGSSPSLLGHIFLRERRKKWPKKHWPPNDNWSKEEIKEPRRRRGKKALWQIFCTQHKNNRHLNNSHLKWENTTVSLEWKLSFPKHKVIRYIFSHMLIYLFWTIIFKFNFLKTWYDC